MFLKILIIDNDTKYLSELRNLLSVYSLKVVHYSEINTVNVEDFDAIILSGGHSFPVQGNDKRLEKEINLILHSTKPIFGICFGFEVIANVLGARLERMENKERAMLTIEVVEPDEVFLNISDFQVFESHRWVVKAPTEEMVVLAHSKDGIEAFKHKNKKIYAVQFHPEMFVEKSCGDEILNNFLRLVQ